MYNTILFVKVFSAKFWSVVSLVASEQSVKTLSVFPLIQESFLQALKVFRYNNIMAISK